MKALSYNKEKSSEKIVNQRLRGDKIFYWSLLAWPIIQFIIFYIYVNIDGFVMAFQRYDVDLGTYSFGVDPLVNFKRFFSEFSASDEVYGGMLRSLFLYCFGILISSPIVLYLSFIMYKKVPGHHFFKVMLYVPNIISSTVWVLLYTQLMENAVPALVQSVTGVKIGGIISNVDLSFGALLFFGKLWFSLGSGTLLYIAGMSGIPEERSEAMKIDGAGSIREFIHLTFPSIWNIFSIGIYMGVTGILLSDVDLYTFFGESAPANVRTFGYWLTVRKFRAASNIFDLPYIAAIGMLQGFIFIPLMFIVKKSLQKFGPSED